jgi:uncharacterized protein (TIGR02246 family)
MKYLLVLTVGVCLLVAAVPVMAQSSADEAAIREVSKRAWAAYSAKDLKAFMACYGENNESWDGDFKGPAGLEKEIARQFKQSKDGQVKTVEEIGIHFLSPDVAIYKFRDEISGFVDEAGKPRPSRKRLVAQPVVKKDGKWLVAGNFTRPVEE